MTVIHSETIDNIGIISLRNNPVNGLSYLLRDSLVKEVDKMIADNKISAIVITGSDKFFSVGADIGEFKTGQSSREPTLLTVLDVLENSTKPIIAAISGFCLGGGLELALAAHFRIATKDAAVGLPEIKLGLIPGAGGTQRLPRLIGFENALNFIVTGDLIPAEELKGSGLFDLVVTDNLIDASVKFAQQLRTNHNAVRRVRDLSVQELRHEAISQYARNQSGLKGKNGAAVLGAINAVQASLSPFTSGMKTERQIFEQLIISKESKALRHIFNAERLANKIPDVSNNIKSRPITQTAVIGGGTMGTGIAMSFLNSGIPVILMELDQVALDRGLSKIKSVYSQDLDRNRITQSELDFRMNLLTTTVSYADLGSADLVVEAVFEEMSVKQDVFRSLSGAVKFDAILASNTSTLDLDKIAETTSNPSNVVGMHFFSPAHIMKLLEIVRGQETAPEVLKTCLEFTKRINKQPVISGVCDGFIGNRMLHRYYDVANGLLLQGATPHQIDGALENFGMAMGPFRVGDLSGLDIGWAIRKRRAQESPDKDFEMIADKLCEAGRFGQKTLSGWYRYEKGSRKPIPDPEVIDIIEKYRIDKGIEAREITDEEIVRRSVCALVNEGAKILEEKIAFRASDIDVAYVHGYGFPRALGGPMHYAEEIGLFNILRSINEFASESEAAQKFWSPSTLLIERVEAGGSWI